MSTNCVPRPDRPPCRSRSKYEFGFPSQSIPISGRDSTEQTARARMFPEGKGQTADDERQPGKSSSSLAQLVDISLNLI